MSAFLTFCHIDSNGTEVVKYEYDAWGNHSVSGSNTDLGKLNPFRYRSYFYDTETGLYYLKSRYYDPYIGRFISMDDASYADPETVGGLNLYAYCGNNPVMNVDPDWHFVVSILSILTTIAIGTLIGGVVGGVAEVVDGGNFWTGFAGGSVSGLITTIGMGLSLATGGVAGLFITATAGFLGGFVGNIVQQGLDYGIENIDFQNAFKSGIVTSFLSVFSYGFSSFAINNSIGLFEGITDKSLKFTSRLFNSLSLSVESSLLTLMYSMPFGIMEAMIGKIRKAF